MADDDDEAESGPLVELDDGAPVDGMPLARLTSRLSWGIEKSRLREREADTEIRTPDGPKRLGDVLDRVDASYFARRQDLADAVEAVVGTGPVPTAEGTVGETETEDTATNGEGEDGEE